VRSDFEPDIRSLSFSVDLTCGGIAVPADGVARQDFSLQSATPFFFNNAWDFRATMKIVTAESPVKTLWSLSPRDKLRVLRALSLAELQTHQPRKPYQQLRYWSCVPFRHGPEDVVKQSATAVAANLSQPLQRGNPDALRDELVRHLNDDDTMSSFEFGVQFLDTAKMTYWGKHRDANFWIENASVEWSEAQAPFHVVGRLTLSRRSQLISDEDEAIYFDVTRHSSPDSMPVGSINRARWGAEMASRQARMHPKVAVDEAVPSGAQFRERPICLQRPEHPGQLAGHGD
jgi:hypothetical protein